MKMFRLFIGLFLFFYQSFCAIPSPLGQVARGVGISKHQSLSE